MEAVHHSRRQGSGWIRWTPLIEMTSGCDCWAIGSPLHAELGRRATRALRPRTGQNRADLTMPCQRSVDAWTLNYGAPSQTLAPEDVRRQLPENANPAPRKTIEPPPRPKVGRPQYCHQWTSPLSESDPGLMSPEKHDPLPRNPCSKNARQNHPGFELA